MFFHECSPAVFTKFLIIQLLAEIGPGIAEARQALGTALFEAAPSEVISLTVVNPPINDDARRFLATFELVLEGK